MKNNEMIFLVMVSKIFGMFIPKFGEDEPILTHMFSNGLKPPTSYSFWGNHGIFGEGCPLDYSHERCSRTISGKEVRINS